MSTPRQVFRAGYEASDRSRELLADRHLLALIRFAEPQADPPIDPRLIEVGLPQLGSEPLCEVWRSAKPVTTGVSENIKYACTDDLVMGHLAVAEEAHGGIEQAGLSAYGAVIDFTRTMGFAHFLRIWNYIPDINGEGEQLERYKSFCIGRHRAFAESGLRQGLLPASTGVGLRRGDLLVYFIAAREPGYQVENPRQVSAFEYPPQYGPKSPSFSRATAKRWGDERHLYISGTASIVGHESRHGDVASQLDETLENIARLIDHANEKQGVGIGSIADLSLLKVYVRHVQHMKMIRERLEARIGDSVPSVYLHSDLCRRNLLLELEGLYTGP